MSIMQPELEYVDRSTRSIRYLEHGWPTELCRWHAHEEYELHLIIETNGKAFVGDYIGDFKPGDLYLTGPNLPHNWVTESTDEISIEVRDMLVQFSHASIERLTEAFPEFNSVLDMLHRAQTGILFDGFNATFARGHLESIRDNSGIERILAFLRFLVRINEHPEQKTLSVARLVHAEGGSKHARIAAVVDHIVTHYREDISVTQAAEMAAMTSATFSRNFQAVTGHTLIEFVNNIRISQACALLYASDDPVTVICHQSGFRNVANFNRHFLKVKGMTPSTYRETARRELANKMENA